MSGKNGLLLAEMQKIQVESSFEATDGATELGDALLRVNDIATAAIKSATNEVNFDADDKRDAIARLNAEHMILAPGGDLQIQEVMDKFAVIFYDIPATKEGNAARLDFLSHAKFLGAVMITESAYMAPFSITAELELFKAAEIGKVRILVSVPLHKEDCLSMTREYDQKLAEVFKEAEDRWDKIEKHLTDQQFGLVHKMLPKTVEQVASLKKAAIARGSQSLYDRWEALSNKVSFLTTFFTMAAAQN